MVGTYNINKLKNFKFFIEGFTEWEVLQHFLAKAKKMLIIP